ncbi:MAG: hypothetical protein ACT4NY_31525 [Pseudonocardiales bacterium]
MAGTRTRKLVKRYTPFSYKHAVTRALCETFQQFAGSTIVVSCSSNVVPGAETIEAVLREVKGTVEVRHMDHRYSFGTHATLRRRAVCAYLFIGR